MFPCLKPRGELKTVEKPDRTSRCDYPFYLNVTEKRLVSSVFFSADLMATVILQKVANPDCSLRSLSKGWKPGRVRGLLVTQGSPKPPNISLLGCGHAPLILLQQEHKTEGNSGLIGRQKEQEESWFFFYRVRALTWHLSSRSITETSWSLRMRWSSP